MSYEIGQLESMAHKLEVYDVRQGAWEQEPNGYEANAKHVLTHLAKDLALKDFNDPQVVEKEIAPDMAQYAFRLVRWGNVGPHMVLDHTQLRSSQLVDLARRYQGLPEHQVATIAGMSALAKNLHDWDHASTRLEAQTDLRLKSALPARYLFMSAVAASEKYEFDLSETFDNRLNSLRERFGVPQPPTE